MTACDPGNFQLYAFESYDRYRQQKRPWRREVGSRRKLKLPTERAWPRSLLARLSYRPCRPTR